MGLLDRFFGKVSLPRFSVAAYGKLPCHKEYLHVGGEPGFQKLRQRLDAGFEARISARLPRPHVLPDRRFYVRLDGKNHLVGCIFESDDGIRAFPFLLAAPFPSKTARLPPHAFWQSLQQVWTYLEAYAADLRRQPSAQEFYRRVRGVVHQIEPFTPQLWEKPLAFTRRDQLGALDLLEDGVIPALDLSENPPFVLWPASGWQQQVGDKTRAYIGFRGLEDVDVALFRQEETAPRIAIGVPPRVDLEPEADPTDNTVPDLEPEAHPTDNTVPDLEPEAHPTDNTVPDMELDEVIKTSPPVPPPMAPPLPLGREKEDTE